MDQPQTPAYRVAVVWRGDREVRTSASPSTSRLRPIFEALDRRGLHAEPAVYDEAFAAEVRSQLLGCDAALVWVDPISSAGIRRNGLDALLREVADAGVLVSGHPDVIARIGVKAVLHTTRSLGWGSATRFYPTAQAFAAEFPGSLARHGSRVLKQNRGNGGVGVWRVSGLSLDRVEVQGAQDDGWRRVLPLAAFMAERLEDFGEGGGLVDQPFQLRHLEGMIRCYLAGDRVAGFGHQLVRALASREEGPAGPRLYSGPEDPRFQRLRRLMEGDWLPGLRRLLDLAPDDLPLIWDADFLLGSRTVSGEDSYVLCEINASSVFPVPDEAPDALAELLVRRLKARA